MKLSRHNAYLPDATEGIYRYLDVPGFTDYPFYAYNGRHWTISPRAKRFECDDFAPQKAQNTLHLVFVRE